MEIIYDCHDMEARNFHFKKPELVDEIKEASLHSLGYILRA